MNHGLVRSQRGCRAVIGILLTLLFATPVWAFSTWGFQSEMSVEKAKSSASAMGYVVALDDAKEPYRTIGFYQSNADGDAGIGYVASFCNGRLSNLTQMSRGTMGMFVDAWKEMEAAYGKPSIEISSQLLANGRYRWIKLGFEQKPTDTVWITAQTTPGSDSEFRVLISHDSGGACAVPTPR